MLNINKQQKQKISKRNDENYVIDKKTKKLHTNTEKEVKNVKIPWKRKERTNKKQICGNECGECQSFYPKNKRKKNSTKTDTYCKTQLKFFHATPSSFCVSVPIFFIVFIESFSR